MDLGDLRVFKAVVDEGGIVRAARKLHRVPSAVTTRIKQLEASMGVALFHRDRQRLHLSPTGALLLDYADRLIRLSDEARSAVSRTVPRGLLKLGALESTTASRLPAVLTEFHRRYPEVRLELTTGTNDALVRALIERRIDAAFAAEPPSSRVLAYQAAFGERLILISSLDHRPIRQRSDVRGASLIVFPEGCAYRRVLQRWYGRRNLSGARVLELNSYHAIVACVASGAGIALVPESVLTTLPQVRVRRHPIAKAYVRIRTPLVWRAGELSPAVAALRALVRTRSRIRS